MLLLFEISNNKISLELIVGDFKGQKQIHKNCNASTILLHITRLITWSNEAYFQ